MVIGCFRSPDPHVALHLRQLLLQMFAYFVDIVIFVLNDCILDAFVELLVFMHKLYIWINFSISVIYYRLLV